MEKQDALALINRFYSDIMEEDLVYLTDENRQIPVKIDPLMPKGCHLATEDAFVGSPTSIREFIQNGRIVLANSLR